MLLCKLVGCCVGCYQHSYKALAIKLALQSGDHMSGFTFCLLSPKGGVGKTTTAVLLASEIIRHGMSVTLIEADGNQHLASWFELGNCPEGLSLTSVGNATGAQLEQAILSAEEAADYVIIDTQGTENASALRAAALSDVVLIPTTFSPFEVQGALTALEAVQALPEDYAPMLAAVIFTRVDAAIKTRTQSAILNAFDQEGIEYIWPGILQKEVCRQMLKHGCLLHDLPAHTNVANIQNAIDNIQAILSAIVKRIT